jgi:hypothetical protein
MEDFDVMISEVCQALSIVQDGDCSDESVFKYIWLNDISTSIVYPHQSYPGKSCLESGGAFIELARTRAWPDIHYFA